MASVGNVCLVAGHTHMASCAIIALLLHRYSRAGTEARTLHSALALLVPVCNAHQQRQRSW